MMNSAGFMKAAIAALFTIWAVYTEWRLRAAQEGSAKLRRALDKANIKSDVDSLSNDELRAELNKDVSG